MIAIRPLTARLLVTTLLTLGSLSLMPAAAQSSCGAPSLAATPEPAAAATHSGTWHPLPDLPRPRSEFGAAVIGDTVFVAGGFGGPAMVDYLDLAPGTWSEAPDLPVGVHHPGVAALEGVLYVAGGHTEDGDSTGALWAFDPATGAWEERAPMPTARGALGLATLDGRLYAIGGAAERWGGPATGAVEVYDPAMDTWDTAPAMPTPREHLAVAAGDGQLYAIGGRADGTEDERFAAAAEVFDPATGTWETLPPLPTPRGGLSGSFAGGKVIVIGGERGPTTFDTVEAFDPATGEWEALPPLPIARHGIASAASGDTVYAIGGSTLAGRVENTGVSQALTIAGQASDQALFAEPEPVSATSRPSIR